MKTVEVLKVYTDNQLGRKTIIGETFEVDDERGKVLSGHPDKIVRVIETTQTIEPVNYDLTPPLKTPEEFHSL